MTRVNYNFRGLYKVHSLINYKLSDKKQNRATAHHECIQVLQTFFKLFKENKIFPVMNELF